MDLLNERNFGVDNSVGLQNPMNLAHAAMRIGDMFKHRLRDHRVKCFCMKRKIVSVGDRIHASAKVDIRAHQCDTGIAQAVLKVFVTVPRADNQDD
jgi:hypothetical protein